MHVRNSYTVRCLFALLVGSWIVLSLTLPGLAYDAACKVAVDSSGNVYVTGRSWNGANFDYVTIKYSSNGAWLWGRRYNGPANSDDKPMALGIDASGNVYVSGESGGGTSGVDYVTIKYDKDGNWVWGRRYNAPANAPDYATALAVDAGGNVYVTGSSWNGADYDYVTIKYSSNGAWLWGRRYNGPAAWYDRAVGLGVDASGNVYVNGQSWGGASGYDFVTIKYDKDGNWVWGRRYNGPANGVEEPCPLAVDASGNVYVTGTSYGGLILLVDYVTLKYDTYGVLVWGRRYNGPANDDDVPTALAVDAGGNVCVTGYSNNGDNSDYVTIKYDASGAWVWGQRYNSPANDWDSAEALAVELGGNVYVTGISSTPKSDYVTIKYSPGGAWVWGRRYNGPANDNDYAEALAVDANSNVYVTGNSYNAADSDYVTIKYSSSGTWVWGARYDGPD